MTPKRIKPPALTGGLIDQMKGRNSRFFQIVSNSDSSRLLSLGQDPMLWAVPSKPFLNLHFERT